MIDTQVLRYLSSYTSLMKESACYRDQAAQALNTGDVQKWSAYLQEAQRSMDEATRRLEVQHGIDHGQVQKTWMVDYDQLTPLI